MHINQRGIRLLLVAVVFSIQACNCFQPVVEGGPGGGGGGIAAGAGASGGTGGGCGLFDDGGSDYEWARWSIPSLSPDAGSFATDAGGITDMRTHLMWQREVTSRMFTWIEAKSYCEDGGHRLPTLIELESLADYVKIMGPAIGGVGEPNTPSMAFWSQSAFAKDPNLAWMMFFSIGYTSATSITVSGQAWCVSPTSVTCGANTDGGAPPSRYSVSAGTVFDSKTMLSWQRGFSPSQYEWAGAASYCTELSLDGSGWRLPSVKELQSLVNIRAFSPAIDVEAFPNTPTAPFWTSSPYVRNDNGVWVVHFDTGNTGWGSTLGISPVRCVR